MTEIKATRQAYIKSLFELGEKNKDIVVHYTDLVKVTKRMVRRKNSK